MIAPMATSGPADHLFEANPPAESPDGRYRVQMHDETTVDGVPVRGRARLLYDGDAIELAGVERPQEAFVTASGIVSIIDALRADGPATQGALLVFDRTGRRIQMHRFGASVAGARAERERGQLVISTLAADHEDGNTTFTFALSDGRLISRAETVIEDRTPKTAYDWQQRGFEELAAGDTGAARESLTKSLSGDHGSMTPFFVAQAERALGELADAAGDRAAALRHYRAALDANPKVGVKKRVVALERELGH
jgi:tetratricopeptide (TPR) repeat protein